MSLHSYDWNAASRLSLEGPSFTQENAFDSAHDDEMSSSDYVSLPALPGFRRSNPRRPSSAKDQSLSFVNGYMMVRPSTSARSYSRQTDHSVVGSRPLTAPVGFSKEVLDPTDVSGRYSFRRKKMEREKGNIALPFCPSSPLPAFLEHDRRVLLFNAYYEEDVLQSAIEKKRVHPCEVYFFVEDGTIEIIQTKQESSGVPHGVYLRRSKVIKPRKTRYEPGCYYEIDDLKIGNDVIIYSRKFRIASCNESTKRYVVEHCGWNDEEVRSHPLPRDQFAEVNKAKMRRESGVPGVERNRKMHELKQVMESMLGKETSITDRGMFLENGTDALCFQVVWDDRQRLYGDIQYFRLFYYLADDTIEILRTHNKNDGRHSFTKLLKRSKLPKNGKLSTVSDPSDNYLWQDLKIGGTVNVFNRVMIIARCDAFTRQHYLSKGIVLKEDMPLMVPEKKVELKRVIPPYNGFGSEEDSLRSCMGSLNPPPPKKDLQKMRDKNGLILCFNAQLVSDKPYDADRRFVIQFFMEDDTIAIREPPVQNSGIMGGSFLRRQSMKHADGTAYAAKDMYVGNIVDIVGHKFLLLNADECTYRIMECDDRTFPFSNYTRLHEPLASKIEDIKKYFIANYDGNGELDLEGLAKCCDSIGLEFNKQELITVWRQTDRKGKGRIAFKKLLNLASEEGFSTQR